MMDVVTKELKTQKNIHKRVLKKKKSKNMTLQ